MKKIFIEEIIQSFAGEGRIFENEAQFKFDYAWRLREKCTDDSTRIFLERRLSTIREYTDIAVDTDKGLVAIELKYRLADKNIRYRSQASGDLITRAQGAADIGCYGFLKDIERLEKNKTLGNIIQGFAVMISNYPLMWGSGVKNNTNWEPMCLTHLRIIEPGFLNWKNKAPSKGLEDIIKLSAEYQIEWKDYKPEGISEIMRSGCVCHPFKYLIVEI